jgi:hypothetical protein
MSSALFHGFGSPWVKVFNRKGEELNQNINRFSYKYSEDEDDELSITFETDDETILDKPEMQEGVEMIVTWGYLNGLDTGKRKVYIQNIEPFFGPSGIVITIVCTDKLATLRNTSKSKVHLSATLTSLATTIADDAGITFGGIGIDEDGEYVDAFIHDNDKSPSVFESTGNFSAAVDNTAAPIDKMMRIYPVLPQGNKSDIRLLNEVCNDEPGGPYIVEGRDDKLIIKKRNFSQKPLRIYEYSFGDGELISFSPETKNRVGKNSSTNVEVGGWDPLEKKYTSVNVNQSNSQDVRLGDQCDGTPRSFEVTSNEELGNAFPVFTGKVLGENELYPSISTASEDFFADSGYYVAAVDNTAIILRDNLPILDISETIHSIDSDPLDIAAKGKNRYEKAQLDKNPGSATVVGHPLLKTGKLITMLGKLPKKYTGNYYIVECVHELIPDSGYLCYLKLTRNATKKAEESVGNGVDTDDMINNLMGDDEDIIDGKGSIPTFDPNYPDE